MNSRHFPAADIRIGNVEVSSEAGKPGFRIKINGEPVNALECTIRLLHNGRTTVNVDFVPVDLAAEPETVSFEGQRSNVAP